MFRTFTIAAVTTSALAAPAFAGSYQPAPMEPVVPVAPVAVVSGADWTGGYGGLSLGYGDYNTDFDDEDGMVYGIHGGYDYDMGNFVVGGEVEYQANDFDAGATGLEIDSITRLKLRAGYDAGPALVYGVAGAAFVESNALNGSEDTGYTVGLGAEYMVMQNVSVGGEYLYDNVADFDGAGNDFENHTFNARVNYRF